MQNLYFKGSIFSRKLFAKGDIRHAIAEAIALAKDKDRQIQFFVESEDFKITVAGDSDPALIYRDWDRATEGFIPKNVGPYPIKELNAGFLSQEAAWRAERADAAKMKRRQNEDFYAARKRLAEEKLATAPAMEIVNQKDWDEEKAIKDPYTQAAISYAERWARLMQLELAQGKTFDDFAEETAEDAKEDNINGSIYNYAVALLETCWPYGEDLVAWRIAVKKRNALGHSIPEDFLKGLLPEEPQGDSISSDFVRWPSD